MASTSCLRFLATEVIVESIAAMLRRIWHLEAELVRRLEPLRDAQEAPPISASQAPIEGAATRST